MQKGTSWVTVLGGAFSFGDNGVILHIHAFNLILSQIVKKTRKQVLLDDLSRNNFFRAIQKREQPNVPAFAASIPSATYHILDVVGLP